MNVGDAILELRLGGERPISNKTPCLKEGRQRNPPMRVTANETLQASTLRKSVRTPTRDLGRSQTLRSYLPVILVLMLQGRYTNVGPYNFIDM